MSQPASTLASLAAATALCGLLAGCSWLERWTGNPVAEAQRFWERARAAEENGETEKAALLMEKAVRANPEDSHMHLELARFLVQQGSDDAAAKQLRDASRQNPDDADIYVELARIEIERGRYGEANRVLDRALERDAGHVDALLLKAEIAEALRQNETALQTYYRVLARDPDNMTAMQRAAEIQLKSARPERAAPLLRSVCECTDATVEQRADAQWKLGVAYGRQRRWDDAVAALTSALPHRRDMTADDWYRLAYARYRSGDVEGARSDLKTAIRLQPNHAEALAMAEAVGPGGDARPPRRVERTAMLPAPDGW